MLLTYMSVPLFIKTAMIILVCIMHILTLYVFYSRKARTKVRNMGLPPEIASIWYLLTGSIFYLIVDHHIIYLNRVSY